MNPHNPPYPRSTDTTLSQAYSYLNRIKSQTQSQDTTTQQFLHDSTTFLNHLGQLKYTCSTNGSGIWGFMNSIESLQEYSSQLTKRNITELLSSSSLTMGGDPNLEAELQHINEDSNWRNRLLQQYSSSLISDARTIIQAYSYPYAYPDINNAASLISRALYRDTVLAEKSLEMLTVTRVPLTSDREIPAEGIEGIPTPIPAPEASGYEVPLPGELIPYYLKMATQGTIFQGCETLDQYVQICSGFTIPVSPEDRTEEWLGKQVDLLLSGEDEEEDISGGGRGRSGGSKVTGTVPDTEVRGKTTSLPANLGDLESESPCPSVKSRRTEKMKYDKDNDGALGPSHGDVLVGERSAYEDPPRRFKKLTDGSGSYPVGNSFQEQEDPAYRNPLEPENGGEMGGTTILSKYPQSDYGPLSPTM